VAAHSDLFDILHALADAWCERRALNPLRYLLPAYPLQTGTTDEWHELHNALQDIRSLCKDDISLDEKEKLSRAIARIQEILNAQH
jgi:hypothetical protein